MLAMKVAMGGMERLEKCGSVEGGWGDYCDFS